MAEKYTPETEAEVLGWLYATTGTQIAPGMQSMHEALKDGRVLIQCACLACLHSLALHWLERRDASMHGSEQLVQKPVPARRHMNKLLEGTTRMPTEVAKLKVPIKINTMQAPFKQVPRCSLTITVVEVLHSDSFAISEHLSVLPVRITLRTHKHS